MPVTKKQKSIKKNLNKPTFWVFIALFAIIGAVWLYRSFAATPDATAPAVAIARAEGNSQYWIATSDGKVYGQGVSTFSQPGPRQPSRQIAHPIVAMAARPDSKGYWLLGKDCKVYGYGNAPFEGDGALQSGDECRAIVSTTDGGGYWIITKLGRITAYGYAKNVSEGIDRDKAGNNNATTGIIKAGLPGEGIVSAARSGNGNGLLLLDAQGTIYTYGDITQYRDDKKIDANGKTTTDLNWENSGNSKFDYAGGARASALSITRSEGFIVTGQGGKIYTYRNANKQSPGSNPNRGGSENVNPKAKIVGIAYTADYAGYWQLAEDGAIYTYGNAVNSGRIKAPTHDCGKFVYRATASQCPKPSTSSTSSGNTKTGSTPASSTGGANQGNSASSAAASQLTTEVINNCYTQTLRVGSKGDCVQVLLIALKFKNPRRVPPLGQINDYKNKTFTEQAKGYVTAYQNSVKISADGVVGAETWRNLRGQSTGGSGNNLTPASTPPTGISECDGLVAFYMVVEARRNIYSWAARTSAMNKNKDITTSLLNGVRTELDRAKTAGIEVLPAEGLGPLPSTLSGKPYYCRQNYNKAGIVDAISAASKKLDEVYGIIY